MIYSRTIRNHPTAPLAIPLTEFPGAGYGSYTFQSTPGHQWGLKGTWREAKAFAEKWQADFGLPYVDVAFYPPFSVKSHLIEKVLKRNRMGVPPQKQFEIFLSWFPEHRVGASFMTEGRGWYELHRTIDGVPIGRCEWKEGRGRRYLVNADLWRRLERARQTLKERRLKRV